MSFLLVAGAAVGVGTGITKAIMGGKEKREAAARKEQEQKQLEMKKQEYAALDTSNPFANMENVMDDLTVNQQQAEFEQQMAQQNQANILQGMRGAAGGSGIAALAQTMASQGALQAQKASASIGQQEQANQMARQQMAANIQEKEIQGEMYSRDLKRQQTTTLLGMAQQEQAAYAEQAGQAQQAKWDAISGGIDNVTSMIPGVGGAGGSDSDYQAFLNWKKKQGTSTTTE